MYKSILKPLLFKMDPETAHHFTFNFLKIAFKIPLVKPIVRSIYKVNDPKLGVKLWGLNFPNRVGLAAGFDKDAKLFEELSCLGFGFIEIGTLTPVPQPGNPQPRMFRLPDDLGLINRMGFNNQGVEAAVERLKGRDPNIIIGGNIGKNKVTENENAHEDYIKCFNALYDHVDYFVVNVSSPNTPNLRQLQEKEPLKQLLSLLMNLNNSKVKAKPLLLKIAPDLTESQLDDIIEIVTETKIDGIVATNTTISREGLISPKNIIAEAGGLSGLPVKEKSTAVIKYLHKKSNGSIPIIAVGGIFTGEDAFEKLKAGAALVQVYTGFIYEGPGMIKRINKGLISL